MRFAFIQKDTRALVGQQIQLQTAWGKRNVVQRAVTQHR